MDITNMLAALRAERQHIEEAILVLQRLATSGGKRRGRPPKWMAPGNTAASPDYGRKKRVFSLATRRKMAASQKRRWAERKAKTA